MVGPTKAKPRFLSSLESAFDSGEVVCISSVEAGAGGESGANDSTSASSPSCSRSATVARALTMVAEILARLRTIRASCISRASSSSPNAAMASGSKPWNTSRNASRLLRIVDHDSPDWNASRVSRSRYADSPCTRLPHSVSW